MSKLFSGLVGRPGRPEESEVGLWGLNEVRNTAIVNHMLAESQTLQIP